MATAADAELILKLYELRTEETMREARKFLQEFNPSSFQDVADLQRDMGSKNNAYWRQVLSYWDMAATLVLHGTLDGDLFAAANGEPFFLYAKFAPFHAEWQQTFGVPFMGQTSKLVEQFPTAKRKYDAMLARFAAAKK